LQGVIHVKKVQSIVSFAVSAILSAAVLAGCGTGGQTAAGGQAAQPNQAPAAGSGQKPKLVMATSADYKPFEFHDLSSGKDEIAGLDVDIAKHIAEELGYELEIQDMNFDGLIPALQSKRADFAMAGMTPNPERLKNADFSVIYYEAKNSVVSRKESKLTKPEELAGKKVAVQTGSIQEEDAKALAKSVQGLQIVSFNKTGEIIQEVKTGRVDAAILEDTVAKSFIASNPDLQYHTVAAADANGYAVAFPNGSKHVEEFNRVIKHMQENGEMDKLIKKWFGE
jgi:polar amino acid transport system substrate-binding protein